MQLDGKPLEEFLIDPPVPYIMDPFRAPQFIERNGINHLLLWVGAEHYPFVSDFIEEIKQFGCSKRIPRDFPIEKLQRESMMLIVHPKAIIKNHNEFPATEYCPVDKPLHYKNEEYCLGQTYHFAIPNEGDNFRIIGDTRYKVTPLEISFQPEYLAGSFLTLPITNIDYVMTEDKRVDPTVTQKETEIQLNITDE